MPVEGKKPYLPKWAEEEMRRKDRVMQALGERVAELEAAIAGDGGSVFSVGARTELDHLVLPSSVRHMSVKLPNGFEVDIYPQSDGNGGLGSADTIQIMELTNRGISVISQASNTIHIGPRRI